MYDREHFQSEIEKSLHYNQKLNLLDLEDRSCLASSILDYIESDIISNIQNHLSDLENQHERKVEELEEEIKEKENEISELEGSISDLNMDLNYMEDIIAGCNIEIDRLTKEHSEQTEIIEHLNEIITKLTK